MILALLLSPLFAQHGSDSRGNPFQTEADVDRGRMLYRANCADCHGISGKGGRGTDLTTGVYRHGGADEALFRSIVKGIPGTEMPPVALEGKQAWQVVAYLRAISRASSLETGGGDPARGRALMATKGCLSCHSIGDQGSRTSPDLSEIGLSHSLASLESSLLRPSETIVPKNRWVRVTMPGGRTLEGRRLNEDTYSIQFIDQNQRLVSILKAEAKHVEVLSTSPMPSFEGKLTAGELADILACLASLRGSK